MGRPKAASVDDYLASVSSEDALKTLQWIRKVALEELQGAEELISYGIPSYKKRVYLFGFAAFKSHCSIFPGHTVAHFADELRGYKTSKGTLSFPPDKPVPEELLRRILRQRLVDVESVD